MRSGHGSLWGQGHQWQRPQGIFIGVGSPGGHHFGTRSGPMQQPAGSSMKQPCSGQTTNRVGTQPHPSADRLPKVILSPLPALNTPLDTALPTKGIRPSSTHQWAGTSSSHQEACTPSRPVSLTRGQTPKEKGTTVLQPEEQRPQTEKVRQNEMAEKDVPDEGTR